MDRNTELNSYGIPNIEYKRYKYNYKKRHQTTGNVGDLIPFYTNILVQPGDTFKIDLSSVTRLTTSKFATMDNLWLDIYFFAQPWISLWDHAKEFWGENTDGAWAQETEYTVPCFQIQNTDNVTKNDIINRIGHPLQSTSLQGTAHKFERLSYNMYCDIYNNWFRDQNYIAPIKFSKGDEDIEYGNLDTLGLPTTFLKAARFHDYFATIPEPQKGPASGIPIGTSAPVKTGTNTLISDNAANNYGMTFTNNNTGGQYIPESSVHGNTMGVSSTAGQMIIGEQTESNFQLINGIRPRNLYADLTEAIMATINATRVYVATQHINERGGWFGTRYREIIRGSWGVNSRLDVQQVPEYLGGKRIPLNMDTVLQTSASDSESPQGNAAGYSVTGDSDYMFTKSFDFHYIIMGIAVVRQDHTYSQGIPIQHQKFKKFDFWWNEFAGLGAVPIYNSEIFMGNDGKNNEVWGYRPYGQEYRVETNQVSGELAPTASGSLDNWNYADYYTSRPVNSQQWIEETPDYVDRTLVAPHTTVDQLMFDFQLNITKITEVPKYNLPGLDKF